MRVVIAEDALLIREGLTRVLAGCGIEVAGTAGSVSGLLDAIDAHQPDVAIVDIRMPPEFGRRLADFSQGRLPAIWHTQAFSSWFLHILLASLRDGQEPGPAAPGGFARGLRDGWVHALQQDRLLARWFAHAYAGVDQEYPGVNSIAGILSWETLSGPLQRPGAVLGRLAWAR